MSRRRMLIVAWIAGAGCVLTAVALLAAFAAVHRSARGRVFADLSTVPVNDVGLVLGTSKHTRGGYRNPHFDNRMTAAAALYHAGRVRHLLLSGDNGSRDYDEPADMKASLEALGVPSEAMSVDCAGFRTLDSVVRARRVFGQSRLTLVTDRFHAYRSVFLARKKGIDAVAYPSADVDLRYSAKTRLRECLADVKACLDLWVLRTQPRFLGEPIDLRVARR